MIQLTFSTQINDFETFTQNSEKISSLNDGLNNDKFEECFTKIFSQSKIAEIDSDNELDFFIQEKPSFEVNNTNSFENKENTLDISKIKSQKIKNKEDISNDLSSIVDSNKSIFYYKNSTIENNNINALFEQTNNKEAKKECSTFLGKKRNFFKIDYPKDFHIFSCGYYNEYSKQIVGEVMDELSKNNSKDEGEGSISISGNKKKHKKIRNVQKRKENSDNIRKKIKSRFLKVLRNTVNERLKIAGSQKLFKFLPQKFISNVSKEKNKAALELTFKDIFSTNYCEEGQKDQSELKNYYHNLEVLKYLEQNRDVSENSNFNIIKNMKYSQIFNEYLKSKEFEMEIASLKKEKENDKYIKDYIIKACDLIDFFSS